MAPHATLQADGDGVALITLVNPPVNALHPALLDSLFDRLREAHARPDVRAIVVTGAGKRFSAGFDINQFQQSSGGGGVDMRINDAFCELLESGPKPTVAAIQGLALGGGLETAMACNARVATPGTSLGLPEVTLGLIPGFGGTQRLPRLVGLQQGAQIILTGRALKERAALAAGLVDAVASEAELLPAARRLALAVAAGARPRSYSLLRTDRLEALGEALPLLEAAAAATRKRAPHLTHPLLGLDAVAHGVRHGGAAGLRREVQNFGACARLDTHAALVHIFLAQRATKRVRGVTDAGLAPRPVRRLAVLGGGLMGSGIATAALLAGLEVVLKEVDVQALEAGVQRVRANLASQVKKGRMQADAAKALASRLRGTTAYDGFDAVDMVIEAAVEDVRVKQQIFADLERACGPACILASNTSTIDISRIGAHTRAATRIVGAHFFSPAHVMPLLEIVRTPDTSKQVVLDTLEFGARIRKTPIVVGNCTGFAVNRVFFPYTQAACLLVDLGLDPYAVDAAIAAGFGMPMGPFRLSDLVGADVGQHVGANFARDFGERVYAAPLIGLLNGARRLGEKTGAGFYRFDARRRASPDPALAPLVQRSREVAGVATAGAPPPRLSPQDIAEFVFFPVVNEGCRVVAEGVVDKPADLDVASVLAMGFPAHRGGLIKWADSVGAQRIVARLEGWAAQYLGAGLAGFFQPCAYLAAAATSGTPLGAGVQAAKL